VCYAGLINLDEAGEMAFVYHRERLNTAVTRSKKKTILLCDPRVLNPTMAVCETAEQQAGFELLARIHRSCAQRQRPGWVLVQAPPIGEEHLVDADIMDDELVIVGVPTADEGGSVGAGVGDATGIVAAGALAATLDPADDSSSVRPSPKKKARLSPLASQPPAAMLVDTDKPRAIGTQASVFSAGGAGGSQVGAYVLSVDQEDEEDEESEREEGRMG